MHPALRQVDDLAATLPFAVDDYPAAGRAFARWRVSAARLDYDTVTLWAYCYTYRYLYTRFARERVGSASDIELALDQAYLRVMDNLNAVRQPAKFPHFVSVVCRRALLNHRSRRQTTVEMEDHTVSVPPAPPAGDYDRGLMEHVLDRSISALPPAVAEVARMRLFGRMEYEAIAEATGHPTPTVRTYFSKARTRLREDPALRAYHFDDVLPPCIGGDGAEGDEPER